MPGRYGWGWRVLRYGPVRVERRWFPSQAAGLPTVVRMHPERVEAPSAPRCAAPGRVRYLHAVAAARVSAAKPSSQQQIADIVRVTVDDEVDTGTFTAIVADISSDVLR